MPTTHRALVVVSIMASTAMVALEAMIVATAMPNIVADLGGLNLYSWVFASFLLAQTATTVVFGKLADVRGRKPVMLSGIAVFIVASVLAGFSTSMSWMIVLRLAQGFVVWGAAGFKDSLFQQVALLYPRLPQRCQPLRHQPLANSLPPMECGNRQVVGQPAPSVVADQDGGHELGIVQGDVARVGVARQELRYRALGVGPAPANAVRGFP